MAVCFYTAQWLLDAVVAGGGAPFPIGLIQNAVGGSMIEQWTPFDVQSASGCVNTTCLCSQQGCNSTQPIGPNCTGALGCNGGIWRGQVQHFVNTTIKMWLYFQGWGDRARAARAFAQRGPANRAATADTPFALSLARPPPLQRK